MTIPAIPATVLADFYKISHRMLYPEGTTEVYSTWTPRSAQYFSVKTKEKEYAVGSGFQLFVKKYLVDFFNDNFFNRPEEDVVAEYEYIIKNTLGAFSESSHIRALHRLGYLPLEIKAVPEGTKVPIKVPTLTIRNTEPEFYWLTNYLETIMSSELWLASNSATIAAHFRTLLDKWATKTTGSIAGVEFQGHDFSFRGMQGLDSAIASGLGHLMSFVGTDNIPAIVAAERYYGADLSKELIGTSVPATEHSIMSSFGRDEVKAFSTIIDSVPEGIVSIVSDTYDFWNVLETVLPTLKDKIMARNGKVVIRPDSGNPIDILCGTSIFDLILTSASAENPFEFLYMHVPGIPSPLPVKDFEDLLTQTVAFRTSSKGNEKGALRVLINNVAYMIPYLQTVEGPIFMRMDKIEEMKETPAQKGAIRMLWDTFGGTLTDQGYRILDSHIGLLYGDAITFERADEISAKLAQNGFASTNVVFGIGLSLAPSYSNVC